MRKLLAILSLSLAACSSSGFGGGDDNTTVDATPPSDAGTQGCAVSYDPSDPVASPILPIRAFTTIVGEQGVLSYTWSVRYNGMMVPFTTQSADGSQINFIAA